MNTSHLFVALVMLFCWSNQITAQNKELINHIDALGVKDYLELNERQGNELSHLLPVLKNGFDNHEAKVIFKRSKHVSHNLIVVEISPMDMVPGATLAIVHFFREDGELIKSHVFNVGYRESLYSIRVMKSPEINDYMVEIQTHGMSEGGGQQLKFFNNEAEWRPRYRQYTQHQLYAFQNNQV